MDDRQTFHWAVKVLAQDNWDPAFPDHQKSPGELLTVQQACERVLKLDEPLPDDKDSELKHELFEVVLRGYQFLQSALRIKETYAVAADCVLKYLSSRLASQTT